MTSHPRVHVILVNYNGWRDTLECLESLFRLDYQNFRVVVCDNGSENDSLARIAAWAEGRLAPDAESERLRHLSSPPVRKPICYRQYDRAAAERGRDATPDDVQLVLVQTGANLGFAGGNNVGLRYLIARDETGYAWLLNNDTVVAPDALTRLVEAADRDDAVGVVGARLYDYEQPDVVQAAGGGKIRRWYGVGRLLADGRGNGGRPTRAEDLDYVTGASMLIPLPALASVGLMDERYFAYAEEADWCVTMRSRGFRIGYAPDARVWHKEGRTIGRKSPFQDYLIERNALLLVRKFFPRFLPVAISYSVYRSLLPKLVRGEWSRVAAIARAYRDFARTSLRPRADEAEETAAMMVREAQPRLS